jgi:hypothetical protein
MRIAVMQPYFLPYAGYFRLFQSADLVVILDCVQFPRRGWVHRNRLPDFAGEMQWLTIPLHKMARDTLIHQLKLGRDYQERWHAQLQRFPVAQSNDPLSKMIVALRGDPVEFIIDLLGEVTQSLNLPFKIARSHTLDIPKNLRGQQRIIAIAKHFGAVEYINLAGGRELYSADLFAENQLALKFLTPYVGDYSSIWSRLLTMDPLMLRNEIIKQTTLSLEPTEVCATEE